MTAAGKCITTGKHKLFLVLNEIGDKNGKYFLSVIKKFISSLVFDYY